MGRPVKWRRINYIPSVMHFVPSGQSGSDAEMSQAADNVLLVEECEAIRLKDLEGLEQEECADQMQVSRPTFQRILTVARQKIADSLINGKGIRIEGGNYTRNVCTVQCLNCGTSWDESVETLSRTQDAYACPQCRSNRIICVPIEPCPKGHGRRGRNCQRGCWRDGLNQQLIQKENESRKKENT